MGRIASIAHKQSMRRFIGAVQRIPRRRVRQTGCWNKEVNLPTENRGDNIFTLARKTGAPVERYPKELYVD